MFQIGVELVRTCQNMQHLRKVFQKVKYNMRILHQSFQVLTCQNLFKHDRFCESKSGNTEE